jgi:hypothetical protein
MSPLNIKGIPYDSIETCRWILKHTIYDLFYPLVLGLFALSTLDIFNRYFLLLVLCEAAITTGLFFYYWIRSVITREKNTGQFDKVLQWSSQVINPTDEKDIIFDIAFVGDIMKMKNYTLMYSFNIQNFFRGVDLIVGNLEGLINNTTKRHIVRQKHNINILQNLASVTNPPPNWLLCISNNHSGDFDQQKFFQTQRAIEGYDGFNAFGYPCRQNYSPIAGINIVSGTMWNNYKNNYSSQFRDVNTHYEPQSFNIMYPHWHFENECYIRRREKKKSRNLATTGVYHEYKNIIPRKLQRAPIRVYNGLPGIVAKWGLIFGHHSHVPQPIVIHPPNNPIHNHLIAYSGGNFTSSKWIRYDFRATKLIFNMLIVSIFYFLFTPIISHFSSIPIFTILEVIRNSIFVIGVQFIAVWVISWIIYKFK